METDYKKKYEDAMARMELCERTGLEKKPDYIFSELRESDDERIINQLITLVNSTGEILLIPTNKEELVAWLNKCKESLHVSKTCKENADSFTDEDEKIMKRLIDYFKAVGKSWTHRDITGEQILCWLEKQKNLDKMIVVSPEVWDNAISEAYENGKKDGEKQKEQEPIEWSDTDNIGWDEAFACVTRAEKAAKNEEELQNAITAEKWLKEIKFKYYVHPVKQEWSEKDKETFNNIIEKAKGGYWIEINEITWLIDCFKSIRPQPSWKPSEEQMEALDDAIFFDKTVFRRKKLVSLLKDLKKLM